eukprot:SAG31_NODE_3572_length_4115_cov_2.951693_3_plen_172_part_00
MSGRHLSTEGTRWRRGDWPMCRLVGQPDYEHVAGVAALPGSSQLDSWLCVECCSAWPSGCKITTCIVVGLLGLPWPQSRSGPQIMRALISDGPIPTAIWLCAGDAKPANRTSPVFRGGLGAYKGGVYDCPRYGCGLSFHAVTIVRTNKYPGCCFLARLSSHIHVVDWLGNR